MKKLIFVIGASGSGKTSTVKKIQNDTPDKYKFCYFDHLGVPSDLEVVEKYGGWDSWQRERTIEWVKRIKENYIAKTNVIFEAQTRPEFIEDTCRKLGISNYSVVLMDCSYGERKRRLIKRNHLKLINDTLLPWTEFLRNESIKRNYTIIDNTNISDQEGVEKLKETIEKLIA